MSQIEILHISDIKQNSQYHKQNRKDKSIANARCISICLFFGVMAICMIVGLIIPIRPTVSDLEKRTLTPFPEFSMAELINGNYFDNLNTWYADSYPGRETMISIDDKIKNLYGIKSKVEVVGNSIEADEIPDFEYNGTKVEAPQIAENTSAMSNDDISLASETGEAVSVVSEDTTSQQSTLDDYDAILLEKKNEEEQKAAEEAALALGNDAYKEAEPPKSKAMEAEIKNQIEQSLYVNGDAAYALYYFSLKAATRYTGIIEDAANRLDGIANVYNILVPNSSIILSDSELASLGGTNQSDGVHYYYSLYDKVKGIESVDCLLAHKDEYLFFRTDHHWTALGAYYVYRNYCAVKGIKPFDLDHFEQVEFSPFLGSYYTKLRKPEMEENPDTVVAYIPQDTNDLTFYDENDVATPWSVIRDVSTWNKYSKYNCFIGSDRSWQSIENPVITDGENCLVIKESYGNCFVPFLVDHYSNVYVIDYRYCDKNIINFIKEHDIDDLIIINNVSICGSDGVMTKLESLLK